MYKIKQGCKHIYKRGELYGLFVFRRYSQKAGGFKVMPCLKNIHKKKQTCTKIRQEHNQKRLFLLSNHLYQMLLIVKLSYFQLNDFCSSKVQIS